MVYDSAKHVIQAARNAGINTYAFVNMNALNIVNNDKDCIAVLDDTEEGVHFVRKTFGGAFPQFDGKFFYSFTGADAIDHIRLGGTYDQIKAMLDELNLTLTEEQEQALKNIDASKAEIRARTGDYNKFKVLTEEEYEQLTEEEKAIYDEELKQYKLKEAGIGGVASISVTM